AARRAQALPPADDPPLFQTNISQFIIYDPPVAVPAVRLQRIDGKRIDIASFRGKAILVNFWATWCPPCQRELPLLNKLHDIVRSEPLEIVAISVDKAGSTAVKPFVNRLNIERLRPYLDPGGQIAKSVGEDGPAPFVLYGLPITYIIDRQGDIVGYLSGEADWTSAAGLALLRYYMRR
ncbi:MAG: TlpA family protein disulfide reductase, partial [Acidobacteriales bacterium]|nr:TlpA family protein disulfide reductase [Terriglobales bacterium]